MISTWVSNDLRDLTDKKHYLLQVWEMNDSVWFECLGKAGIHITADSQIEDFCRLLRSVKTRYPSHRLGVVLSCWHWLIRISGSWEFVLTADGWGNGPFITLMEEYWLWCRSTIPLCNSNGLPEITNVKASGDVQWEGKCCSLDFSHLVICLDMYLSDSTCLCHVMHVAERWTC